MLHVEPGSLLITIGAPGSGKSTLLGRFFSVDDEILSTDWMRRKLTGDAANFGVAEQEVGRFLLEIGEIRLRHGLTTVIDSTGPDWVVAWAREMRDRHHVRLCGIAFDLDPEICRERNRSRDRTVEGAAMESLIRRVQSDVRRLEDDCLFDDLLVIRTPSHAEALEIVSR